MRALVKLSTAVRSATKGGGLVVGFDNVLSNRQRSQLERIRQPTEMEAVGQPANTAVAGEEDDDAGELDEAQSVAGVSLVAADEFAKAASRRSCA
jgi:hypothetical protein